MSAACKPPSTKENASVRYRSRPTQGIAYRRSAQIAHANTSSSRPSSAIAVATRTNWYGELRSTPSNATIASVSPSRTSRRSSAYLPANDESPRSRVGQSRPGTRSAPVPQTGRHNERESSAWAITFTTWPTARSISATKVADDDATTAARISATTRAACIAQPEISQ